MFYVYLDNKRGCCQYIINTTILEQKERTKKINWFKQNSLLLKKRLLSARTGSEDIVFINFLTCDWLMIQKSDCDHDWFIQVSDNEIEVGQYLITDSVNPES